MILSKTTNKSCNREQKNSKFLRKRNKGKHVIKKIILAGNVTTRYTENKHKNTGTCCTSVCTYSFSVLILQQKIEKQYH